MNDTKAIAGSHLPYKWVVILYENPKVDEDGFVDAPLHSQDPHHHPGSSQVATH